MKSCGQVGVICIERKKFTIAESGGSPSERDPFLSPGRCKVLRHSPFLRVLLLKPPVLGLSVWELRQSHFTQKKNQIGLFGILAFSQALHVCSLLQTLWPNAHSLLSPTKKVTLKTGRHSKDSLTPQVELNSMANLSQLHLHFNYYLSIFFQQRYEFQVLILVKSNLSKKNVTKREGHKFCGLFITYTIYSKMNYTY